MTETPSRNFHFGLIFLVALNLLPHLDLYTFPVLIVGGSCLIWRVLYELQKVPLPHFLLKALFVGASIYWVYRSYGNIMGLEPGTAMLVMAISLKLIDRGGYHDAMVLLFLNFMLLLARVLESQTLWMTLFGAVDLIVVTALLVQLHSHQQLTFNPWALLKTGGKLILQVSPFMFLLFFVFPRLSSNLSILTSGPRVGTGFSSEMNPGSISQVAQSEATAFRVRFSGSAPPPSERYWRGAVLAIDEGMSWSIGEQKKSIARKPKSVTRKSDYQEIVLEPRYNGWLFALDVPQWIELASRAQTRQLSAMPGHYFSLDKISEQSFLYKAYSQSAKEEDLDENVLNDYLKAPKETDPRVLNLVAQIKRQGPSTKKQAYALLTFYRNQFQYTLNPGPLKDNSIAEFLFEKKIGFCEHFAVSFAHLMRLAGIPSRVVVGFQGAQPNEFGDYYLVKDKDAHAWTEIWSVEDHQWLRYDPTQVVAPLRFELGGEVFHSLSRDDLLAQRSGEDYLLQYQNSWTYKIFGRSRLALDMLATRWNLFLLNYNRDGQEKFLANLGFKNLSPAALGGISLFIFICFLIWVRWRNLNHNPISPAEKIYLDFCHAMEAKGYPRGAIEGPQDYLNRLMAELPKFRERLQFFKQDYLSWRYGNHEPQSEQLQELIATIRQVKRISKRESA